MLATNESQARSPANDIAQMILDGFDKHYRLFRETSTTAKGRWESRDWAAVRQAWQDRIEMYDTRVAESVALVTEHFIETGRADGLWPSVKLAYIGLLYERQHKQPECAETFFNSVVRRVLERRYYTNEHIFRRPAISTEHIDGAQPTYVCHYPSDEDALTETFTAIFAGFGIANPWRDQKGDAERTAAAIRARLGANFERRPNFQIQVLRSLFFRNKSAFVAGRVQNGTHLEPFVLPLAHDESGAVVVDAVVLDLKNLGRVFSLGRAYFMVDMEVPSAYVEFLASLVPDKPRNELYTMVGLQKQGKTLLFRDLEQHLKHSSDAFVLAPGTKGMVMTVFTLLSFPYVFKVIRDWFAPPKDVDRRHVEERYDFVKKHDRVGRLADTLEFEHVAFPVERFAPGVLDELAKVARTCIERREGEGGQLVIKHLYAERRLIPLDLYLKGADDDRLREAINEYGTAIKDLAGADIFPGDLLLKNFGVTRYGRVVFYDYDEIVRVTECRFRALPTARNDEDEYASEAWYFVDPRDVFPEQFPQFLFAPGRSRDIFLELHGDLATPQFWIRQQERLTAGLQDDSYPYPN